MDDCFFPGFSTQKFFYRKRKKPKVLGYNCITITNNEISIGMFNRLIRRIIELEFKIRNKKFKKAT